jgi:hypothetical protein
MPFRNLCFKYNRRCAILSFFVSIAFVIVGYMMVSVDRGSTLIDNLCIQYNHSQVEALPKGSSGNTLLYVCK